MRLFQIRVLAGWLLWGVTLAACGSGQPTRDGRPTTAVLLSPGPSMTREDRQADSGGPSLTPAPIEDKIPPATTTPFPTHSPTPTTPVPTPSPAFSATLTASLRMLTFSPWDLVLALDWSPDGSLLAVAAGERARVYDARTLEETHVLEVGGWANNLTFRPAVPVSGGASHILAMAVKDGTVQVWDADRGVLICRWAAHNKGANSVAFSPDGRVLASTGNDAMVRLWDSSAMAGGEACEISAMAEMIGGAYAVPVVCFNPVGEMVASVDLQAIRLRDPVTQRLIRTLRGEASIFDLAFSPDGQWLAAGEIENTVRLWDVETGDTAGVLVLGGEPGDFIWSVAYSPDGGRLAAGSSDGSVVIWDVGSGELLQKLDGHTRAVSSVAFSPDGRWLATGGLDATVWLWQIMP